MVYHLIKLIKMLSFINMNNLHSIHIGCSLKKSNFLVTRILNLFKKREVFKKSRLILLILNDFFFTEKDYSSIYEIKIAD